MPEASQPFTPWCLVPLDVATCWRLLGTDSVGRIVYTYRALPAIVPVNYTLWGESIRVQTAPSSRLGQLGNGTIVAFEVDSIDRATRTGWSVVLVGPARALDPADEHAATGEEAVGPPAWVSGAGGLTLSIAPGLLTGRELRSESAGPPGSSTPPETAADTP